MEIERFWVLWAKQKNNELQPGETEELNALLQQQPEASLNSEMLDYIWNSNLKPYPSENLPGDTWQNIERDLNVTELPRKVKPHWFAKSWQVAATLIACIGVSYFAWRSQHTNEQFAGEPEMLNRVITEPDSKSQIELPDGTTVWLNKRSKLTYSNDFFGKKHREVTLVGEAFFDVKKNESVPFIISTNDIKITVKGTAFNVKAYPGAKSVETSLVRGLIEITTKKDPDRKILLKPNEKFIMSIEADTVVGRPGVTEKEPTQFHAYAVTRLNNVGGSGPAETSWMSQRLTFNDENLEALVPRLESWYNINIHIKDEKLKKVRFSGAIEKESPEQLLKVLQLSFPFSYKFTGDQLVLDR